MISTDEEIELSIRIREGDKNSLHRLVNANLRFVVSVSKQYQNQGLSLGDLINEGNLGLIKAAKRFDETRGFKFISYAVWWIRQSILQALADQSRIVRIPLNKVGVLSKVSKTMEKLEQIHEREPTDEEIAAVLDVPIDDIFKTLESYRNNKYVSLYDLVSGQENILLLDTIQNNEDPTDNITMKESLKKDISRVIATLKDEKQEKVIMHYFGLDGYKKMSIEEISEKINVTRERVRQIKEKALRKLGKPSKSRILREYLN